MKAILYARVSTRDQKTIPDQLADMRAHCARQGWKIIGEYHETESGKRDTRPKRAELLKKVYKGGIDVVLVWKLDRFGRSTADLLNHLVELSRRNVSFVSITESLDLTTPMGRAMAGMLAVFAEFEREMIVDRVRAGVNRYRERHPGKWGRPAKARAKSERVIELDGEGWSMNQIASELKIGRSSVSRILSEQKKGRTL